MERARGPRAFTPQIFAKVMEKAVPLDPIGDERIHELLSQLRDERDRRVSKKQPQKARHS